MNGTQRRFAGRGGQFAAVVVATTTVLLLVVAIVGSFEINRSARETQRAVLLNTAYQHAASGVAAEESFERLYLLEPGPEAADHHRDAEHQVITALAEVREIGSAEDRQLASQVLSEQAGYVTGETALFNAVGRHAPRSTIERIDDNRVDPVATLMQNQIYAAADRHEAAAIRQADATRSASRLILGIDIATLLIGLILILTAGAALVRSQRRLRDQSSLNRHQALHDGLTGLPNRALFQDRAEHALAAARRTGTQVAVMIVDLNRFKDINDTLGHQYGDVLLGQVGERFTSTMRAGDTVARLGGDEFAVLLNDSGSDDAVAAAERLTETLGEPFTVRDISLDVDACIGIAVAGRDSDVETLLRHADVAMYEAKRDHVAFATYELTRDDNTIARLAMLGDLRRGIPNQELVLHYQPKVSAMTGELHSVEALVRWQHPTRGLLAPDAFIPIAENTAVIHPLTEEVLRLAMDQARSWQDQGWEITVAVNISARSLHDVRFPAQIRTQLEASGLPASLISLELTESAVMHDPARALAVLDQVNHLGIALSIDDFGTGYSSMAYLKALPVQELKIDRMFVAGLTANRSDAVLVQSAVDLGHNLGLHVVAEGVEDADTQDMLASLGCDLMQGYFINRPVPACELEDWLDLHHSHRRSLAP
jgi:diguanylate cyclase